MSQFIRANPFNQEIKISYQIDGNAGKTTLNIYNILGQRVAELVSEWQEPGNHQYFWNPGHLPSGMYFCRLTHQSTSVIKKLVYLKNPQTIKF